ncbi:MAG: L-serine ammonia-lyase, iron-sulfur-dependent, subunit alpha [Lachnospiraceae bacterium]|nr:L-serine ammonia-lyase, iron-sulfur-dependent, subunit alpha [Lachnospiraceae bacterium]MDD7025336.1 L-serine ammonia-lyase, iron-sulfur-dependent, subunit alpha [Oscillospiraceae bacterium]
MSFQSLEQICTAAKECPEGFYQAVLREDQKDRQVTEEASREQMRQMYAAMKSADAAYDGNLFSASGFVGCDGEKMERFLDEGKGLCGDYIGRVIMRALKMGECNACMRRIVAAPTAGSCGVLPAVLLTYEELNRETEERMIEALYVAAGIGQVIAERASISGAEGGCQAEIGSASAMAAGALAYLQGGSPQAVIHAAAMALKNLLGLVCDPVAGLVEVPCVKRNVIGAVNAAAASEMAAAGITSVIPPDEVIDAMQAIGRKMDTSLRETGEGGLAVTPTARKLTEKLKNM